MSSEAHLPLLLDAPLQCWGFSSRFQRRGTGLHPTKSGVIGLLAAALGIDKHASDEGERLAELGQLRMTAMTIPRRNSETELPLRRLEDYHTVGAAYDPDDPWQRQMISRAAGSGKPKIKKGQAEVVVTHRQFLLDARFGVILTALAGWTVTLPSGERGDLRVIAAKLRDPVWGVWFGRKCCIPATPLFIGGPFGDADDARRALLQATGWPESTPPETFTRVEEAKDFETATDTWNDLPLRSGPTNRDRDFTPRRVRVVPKYGASVSSSPTQTSPHDPHHPV